MLWIALFAVAADDVVEDAAPLVEPAVSTLAKTIIGALLVVSWAITFAAVYVAYRAQEARIADQKAINERTVAIAEKSHTVVAEFKSAIEGLKQSDQTGQTILQGLKSSFDLYVLAQTVRRNSPPSGTIPAVRDPRDPRSEGWKR